MGISTTAPSSVLSIDGNGTPTTTGDVFQTDAPSGSNTFWRMYRAGSQKGDIFNNTGDNHFNIQAYRTDGNLAFYTCPNANGTGVERMTIVPGGNVGIHINTPQSLLHIDGTASTAANVQITNGATTGNGSGNGFLVGVGSNGDAILNSALTSSDMKFQMQGSTTHWRKS